MTRRCFIGRFEIRPDERRVVADAAEVPLGARAFDLLLCLIEHRDRVVTKDELLARVWPNLVVEENNITVQASALRKALGPQVVVNVPGRGYRLGLAVTEAAPPAPVPPAEAPPALPLPDRPSLAVLAFTNLSGDAEQEYFADGVVDDIITALSRLRALFVIARTSSFVYKGRAVDVKQVARELGVRYVLEGSVRRAAGRVRIVAQLIDAESGRHIWADHFDARFEDIFELQDRVTECVAGAIEPTLRRAEIERARSRPTADLNAYDLCLRATSHAYAPARKSETDEAIALLRKAIAIDPGYSYAKALCAFTHAMRRGQNWDEDGEVAEGLRLADEALRDHRDDPATLACAAHALALLGGRNVEALNTIDCALALNPNSVRALQASGWIRNYTNRHAEAIEHFERVLRINPLDPDIGHARTGLGFVLLKSGRSQEALAVGLRALQEVPNFLSAYRLVITCLVWLDRLDEARQVAARLRELAPELTVAKCRTMLPFSTPGFSERYMDALEQAGIPE